MKHFALIGSCSVLIAWGAGCSRSQPGVANPSAASAAPGPRAPVAGKPKFRTVRQPILNLDRIDQGDRLPRDHLYHFPATGQGADVFVLDSWIRRTHTEFEGRVQIGHDALASGPSLLSVPKALRFSFPARPDRCGGHGTM